MEQTCAPPILMRLYGQLMHRIPVSSGLTRLSFNFFTNRQFSHCHGLLMAALLNKMLITTEPNDYNGRVLYLFGTNDPKVQAVVQALLCPGDRFLDIGANYSSIGLLAIDSVTSDGQIHLFEPQPQICHYVEEAIKAAGITNVYLHKVALMDHDGEMRLSLCQNHSGMATLVDSSRQDGWDSIPVPVRDIAAYVQPLVGSKPFGVKIDVEGAEPVIMPWLLKQPNLKFLVFEADRNQKELWDLVKASELVPYGLKRLVFARRISRIQSYDEILLYHDLVAIRFPASFVAPQDIDVRHLGQMINRKHV